MRRDQAEIGTRRPMMQRNPYVAPNALPRSEKEPGRVHLVANVVMLGTFAAFALGSNLLIVLSVIAFQSFRDIFAPIAPVLAFVGALGAWGAANVVGLLRRAPWSRTSARVFWITSCFVVWPIPFAVYGFISLGLPDVRRLFKRDSAPAG